MVFAVVTTIGYAHLYCKKGETTMHDSWILTLARVGFAGKSPVAPGTVGSFVAIVFAPILLQPLPFIGRLVLLGFVLWIGIHACTKAEELLQKKDPGEVVIDEVFGQWITCLPFVSLGLWEYAAAFAQFRLFDIVKPPPVRVFESLPKGLGIMMDDAMAGVYAMVSLGVLRLIFG